MAVDGYVVLLIGFSFKLEKRVALRLNICINLTIPPDNRKFAAQQKREYYEDRRKYTGHQKRQGR